ncbi:hypothetical protein [Thermotalea metallivorans]|nr:hypothetical protein [Thermotalea metallivorans]
MNVSICKLIKSFLVCHLALLIIIFLLSSCNNQPADLLSPPLLDKKHHEAFIKIKNFIPKNSKLTSPLKGDNKNAVYLLDYNNDEAEEIIYFYKTEDPYAPLRMGIIKDNSFINATSIGFSGNEIDKFCYYDFDRDGIFEFLILKMNSNGKLKDFIVVKEHSGILKAVYAKAIEDFELFDVDGDGIFELLEFDKKHAKMNIVKFKENDRFERIAAVDLDGNLKEIKSITIGRASKDTDAIFIDEQLGEEISATELLILQNEREKNVFSNYLYKYSEKILKPYYVKSKDVDGDGIIEIAIPEMLNHSKDSAVWIHKWFQWDRKRGLIYHCSTYDSMEYYFVIPRFLDGKIHIEIEEEKTLFYSQNREKLLFSIYKVDKKHQEKGRGDKIFEVLNADYYLDCKDISIRKDEILKSIWKHEE